MRAPGTGAAARIVLALAGAVVLALGGSPTAQALAGDGAASVSPTGTATLRGVLLHGDPPTPVGGSKVMLHGVAAGADALTLSVVTDKQGRFVFDRLAGGDAWSYTVTADSSGTQWSTDVLAVQAGKTLTTTLRTYDVTSDPAGVVRTEWLVWLDVEGSTVAVQQDLSMTNSGARAYTGSEPVQGAPDGGKAAVTLPVLPGATSLSYLGSFEVCCDAVSGSTWVHTRPVPPGTTTGTLRYEAASPSSLAFPVTTQTQTFTLLVPSGTQVASAELSPAGTQTDRGVTYQVLKGGPLAVGTTITVTLGSAGGPGASTAVGIAVVLGLVLLGLLAWWLLRRRASARAAARPAPRRPGMNAATTAGTKAATKAGTNAGRKSRTSTGTRTGTAATTGATSSARPNAAPTTAAAGAPATTARPADDPGVLADELAMLDLAHESGALPDEESYQRVRAALVDRLVAAVGDDPDALAR